MGSIDAEAAKRARNLGYFFAGSVRRVPDRVAIIDLFGGRERASTYRALDERMDRVARLLRGRGIAPGQRVGMLVGNRTEFLEIFFGAMRAGASACAVRMVRNLSIVNGRPPASPSSSADGARVRRFTPIRCWRKSTGPREVAFTRMPIASMSGEATTRPASATMMLSARQNTSSVGGAVRWASMGSSVTSRPAR